MTVKDELHALLDELADPDARLWLEAIRTRDPFLIKLLLAPEDDELETEEERAAIAEAEIDIVVNGTLPLEVVRRELGL